MDPLILADRVRNTITLGESHFREFKSALWGPAGSKKPRNPSEICDDIAEALVAFANADGGELLVGVEDDGEITGVPHGGDDVSLMLRAPATHVHSEVPLPLQFATALSIDDRSILYFSVSKGTAEIYQLSDGKCLRRRDKSTEPESVKRIQFERAERSSRECDREFVDGAQLIHLDLQHVQNLADDVLRGLGAERYLQQIGLAEYSGTGLRLRNAALLLFSKDVQQWHPRCQVRILRVSGNELGVGENYNVRSEKLVQGNIFDLLLRSWEELRFVLVTKTQFGPDARFEQRYMYPEQACREALVNAIAHRDYSVHRPIEVFVFDDRMEIRSPGALLSTLTVGQLQQLNGAHESRNALVARVLRDHKFMRELGEGMRRMFKSMEDNELGPPAIQADAATFSVVLANKSVLTEQQEQWLAVFKEYPLTALQRRILVCGMNDREISQDDIYQAIKTKDRTVYDSEVTGLRNAKILAEIRTQVQARAYAKGRNVKPSQVGRFVVQLPSSQAVEDDVATVFVANLELGVTAEVIRPLFESVGRIRSINVVLPKPPRQTRPFAFVHYFERDAAVRAVSQLNGATVGLRPITVRPYIPKARLPQGES